MKIALVFDNATYGGIASVGINYLKMFKDLGYVTDVYILGNTDEEIVNVISSYCRNLKTKKISDYVCPEFSWKIAERYSAGKYIFPVLYLSLSVVNAFRRWMFCGYDDYDVAIAFSGHINDLTFVSSKFVRAKKTLGWLHGDQIGYYAISKGFSFLYKKIKNIVVLSNDDEFICKKNNDLFSIRTFKIYNPVYISERLVDDNATKLLINKYGSYILSVGRLADDKDPETILKAYRILKDEYGISNKLVFVGDGNKTKELKKYVESYNLEDSVFFEGTRSNVQDYYASAKLFIHSSPLEGLPTVLVEALSFGLPIIASNSVPGVGEILENGKYGVVFPVGDEKKLALECRNLLEDDVRCKKLSDNGKKRVIEFAPEAIKDKIIACFDNLQ